MYTKNKIPRIDRVQEWRAKSAILVMGLLLFETLTGLGIYLLPFSLSTQFMVLVHTVTGLVFIFPFTWYQIRHWLNYRDQTLTHVKMTGYVSLFVTAICTISGVILTIQAIFYTKISSTWDMVHIISMFALIVFASSFLAFSILFFMSFPKEC